MMGYSRELECVEMQRDALRRLLDQKTKHQEREQELLEQVGSLKLRVYSLDEDLEAAREAEKVSERHSKSLRERNHVLEAALVERGIERNRAKEELDHLIASVKQVPGMDVIKFGEGKPYEKRVITYKQPQEEKMTLMPQIPEQTSWPPKLSGSDWAACFFGSIAAITFLVFASIVASAVTIYEVNKLYVSQETEVQYESDSDPNIIPTKDLRLDGTES